VSGLGPSFLKIWTKGNSPLSGSRNAWTRIKNVNGAIRLSNIWNFFGAIQMISCRNWRKLTKSGYITITRRGSNCQWNGSIAAHNAPKKFEYQNPLENFSPRFLGSRRQHPHWLPSKGPLYQRGELLTFAGAIEGHFEGKTLREVHQVCLFLHDITPGHWALANQKRQA